MMKNFILLILLIACLLYVRGITGKWRCVLMVRIMDTSLIKPTSGAVSNYGAQMDVPKKKSFEIPESAINFRNATFNIVITYVDFRLVLKEFAGRVQKQTI